MSICSTVPQVDPVSRIQSLHNRFNHITIQQNKTILPFFIKQKASTTTCMFCIFHFPFSLLISWFFMQLMKWNKRDVSYFPGLVSLVVGLLMWLTALNPVRRRNFELFYYTHQLYAVFVVFFALHVGDFLFSVPAGAIFLFLLDRFLRFWQSRTTVDIVSANSLPCGAVELILSKPRSTFQAFP